MTWCNVRILVGLSLWLLPAALIAGRIIAVDRIRLPLFGYLTPRALCSRWPLGIVIGLTWPILAAWWGIDETK